MNKKYTYEIGKIYGIRKLLKVFKNEDGVEMATTECIICGNIKTCKAYEIHHGKHTSCICQLRKYENKNEKLYSVYANMKYRCYNPNMHEFHNYGGKGVVLCEEWLGENGYENFYLWAINNGYKDGLTIDRIDENGNYEPSNCQWITKSENTAKANKTCQHRKADKGTYYGIDPDGNIYNFDNANQFAKKHDLLGNCVRQVANHSKKTHKGWKFGFISEENQYAI